MFLLFTNSINHYMKSRIKAPVLILQETHDRKVMGIKPKKKYDKNLNMINT